MKIRAILAVCAFMIISLKVHCKPVPVFVITELEGFELTHTSFGQRLDLPGFQLLPDKISGEVVISIDPEKPDEECFIEYQNQSHRLFPFDGGDNLSFLENTIPRGNVYLWTICLNEKFPDGRVLVIMSANLTAGTIGIRNKVFRGKAVVRIKKD